ncbi:MAG TPA: GNAT family N-acetyltransferase [Candidatus Krumholzibacteria bacterium]|nr:GNAT family N-acetyltransferase [Candidatus Krumholzibacteria bacterium]
MESKIIRVDREADLPTWADRGTLETFFHETMEPWNDSPEDVRGALDYLFSDEPGKGGFLVLAEVDGELAAALAMLNTGMKGYVPAHILLFVSVDPSMRGKGIGGDVVRYALDQCEGPVKLHVEYENPAKRLYERLGFTSKYAEMRYDPEAKKS